MDDLNTYVDYTLLKPQAKLQDYEELCRVASEKNYAAVCVPPTKAIECAHFLGESEVALCSVIGFPCGYSTPQSKLLEAQELMEQGVDEIDMVINIGDFLDGDFEMVRSEIDHIAGLCHEDDVVLKVIVETCFLNDEQIADVTKLVSDSAADFIKTSTGFGPRGASLNDIQIFNANKRDDLLIKASGGIRSVEDALKYIELGVERIGTSTAL